MRTGRERLIETLQAMILQYWAGDDKESVVETYADFILNDIRLGIINGKDT